jgi:hypothetical protein
MRLATLAALVSPLLAVSCAEQQPQEAAACGGANGIVASEAWVRAAPEGAPMSAAYLVLCNGGAADRLVGATFEGAGAVELHVSSTSEDGMTGMSQMKEGLPLPAGETVTLAPGGSHIMLIGIDARIADGDAPAITLEFENAPPLAVTLDVRTPAEAAEHSGH